MFRWIESGKRTRTNAGVSWVLVAVAAGLMMLTWGVGAQETGQRTFSSPQEALTSLVNALRAGDKQSLLAILGPEGEDIISSGDEVSDRADRDRFLAEYDDNVEFGPEENGQVEIILGHDDWPFPVPLVRGDQGWFFDTATGKEELLNRRIGRNELFTIQVCDAYVVAQREYISVDWELDGVMEYAQQIVSDPGKRNGLFWPVAPGETPSPLGPLAAQAAAEGYKRGEKPTAFHGYYYRILKGQGSKAAGGAHSYLINGHMVAGFALIAWPADYGASGIMTFVVNRNGIVYEKDLGSNTAATAESMTLYNPDNTWSRAQ